MKSKITSGLVAGILVFAACGEDTPTKAEFIAEGDAICKQTRSKVDPLFEKLFSGGGPDPAKLKEVLPKISTELKSMRDDLDSLAGPADGEKAVDAALKDLDKGVGSIDSAAAAAKAGNESASETLFASFENFEKADEKVRAYGFKECGADEEEEDGEDEALVAVPADQKPFIDQGDAICGETNDKLEPLFGQLFGSTDLSRRADALGKVIPLVREQNDALKALTPPPAIQAQMKEITDAYEANLVKAEEVKAIAGAGDKARYDSEFEKVGMAFDVLDERFRKLGFKECGD